MPADSAGTAITCVLTMITSRRSSAVTMTRAQVRVSHGRFSAACCCTCAAVTMSKGSRALQRQQRVVERDVVGSDRQSVGALRRRHDHLARVAVGVIADVRALLHGMAMVSVLVLLETTTSKESPPRLRNGRRKTRSTVGSASSSGGLCMDQIALMLSCSRRASSELAPLTLMFRSGFQRNRTAGGPSPPTAGSHQVGFRGGRTAASSRARTARGRPPQRLPVGLRPERPERRAPKWTPGPPEASAGRRSHPACRPQSRSPPGALAGTRPKHSERSQGRAAIGTAVRRDICPPWAYGARNRAYRPRPHREPPSRAFQRPVGKHRRAVGFSAQPRPCRTPGRQPSAAHA